MPSFKNRSVVGMVVLLAAAFAASCDTLGPEEPSGPGSLFVDLESPNGAEGAAVFEINGGLGLGTVTSFGNNVFFEEVGESIRVVVILSEPGSIQFQVKAQNVRNLPQVTVLQVADPENDLRSSLAGYEVHVFQMADRGTS